MKRRVGMKKYRCIIGGKAIKVELCNPTTVNAKVCKNGRMWVTLHVKTSNEF